LTQKDKKDTFKVRQAVDFNEAIFFLSSSSSIKMLYGELLKLEKDKLFVLCYAFCFFYKSLECEIQITEKTQIPLEKKKPYNYILFLSLD